MLVFVMMFFLNDTATTKIYTLSLHDALPILCLLDRLDGLDRATRVAHRGAQMRAVLANLDVVHGAPRPVHPDRKSTRLNSSHANISYAVFCLKKHLL